MDIFTVTKASILGEEHPDYGYTYWAEVEEAQMPVMFNSKKQLGVFPFRIVAEEKNVRTSKKGTSYLRLSKVKVEDPDSGSPELLPSTGATKAVGTPAADHEMLVEILDIVRKLGDSVPDVTVDKVADVDPDEEVDLSDIPF